MHYRIDGRKKCWVRGRRPARRLKKPWSQCVEEDKKDDHE